MNDLSPYEPPQAALPESPAFLPFLRRYPILVGALVGLFMRLAAGLPNEILTPMAGPFIFGAPLVVGMVTVYLAERQRRRSWTYYVLAPCLATCLFVVGTLLIMIEGWICALVIIPMFTVMGGIGGLVMGVVCRLTHWPRPAVYSLGGLPWVLILLSSQLPANDNLGVIEQRRFVHAPASVVWQQLNHASDIQASEVNQAWAYRIGVPLPLSGVTQDTPEGKIRRSQWDKGVHFDEVIQEWVPERHLRWTYRFAPDSFPPGALDDHVVIGGRYFDLLDTDYVLTPVGEGTQLDVRIRYRVSTQFNLYADGVAQALLNNFAEVILKFYAQRSERVLAFHDMDSAR